MNLCAEELEINVSWLGLWDLCQAYNSFKFDNLTHFLRAKWDENTQWSVSVSVSMRLWPTLSVSRVGNTRVSCDTSGAVDNHTGRGAICWDSRLLSSVNSPPLRNSDRNPIALFTSINHGFLTSNRSGNPFTLSSWLRCEHESVVSVARLGRGPDHTWSKQQSRKI